MAGASGAWDEKEEVPEWMLPTAVNRPSTKVLGEDEWGREVYKTSDDRVFSTVGNPEYDADAAPSWVTGKEKVTDYIGSRWEDPEKLGKDAINLIADAIGSTYEAVERGLTGDASTAEVAGLAPVMGAAGYAMPAPEGSLRIFAGRTSDKWKDKVGAANEAMRANPGKNYDDNPRELWEKTGIFVGPDGNYRFELDTSKAKFRDGDETPAEVHEVLREAGHRWGQMTPSELFEEIEVNAGFSPEGVYTLGKVLDFPELFENYPDLESLPIVTASLGETKGGSFYPSLNAIVVNSSRTPEEVFSSLMHEVQHWVQNKEGFSGGSNIRDASELVYSGGFDTAIQNAAAEEYKSGISQLNSLARLGKITEETYDQRRADITNKFTEHLTGLPYKMYTREAGEVESRAVQDRLKFSSEERTKTYPGDTYKKVTSFEDNKLPAEYDYSIYDSRSLTDLSDWFDMLVRDEAWKRQQNKDRAKLFGPK